MDPMCNKPPANRATTRVVDPIDDQVQSLPFPTLIFRIISPLITQIR